MSLPRAPTGANHHGPTPESTQWPAARRGVEANRVAIQVSSASINFNNGQSIEYLSTRTNPFEVEICQIHVAAREYVHGKNISPLAETELEKLRGQIVRNKNRHS